MPRVCCAPIILPSYRLCQALENEPQRAQELLKQTFAKAVNQAYRYRPHTGIPVWFYSNLLLVLPRSTRMERRAHLPVLLHAFADLSPEQISTLLDLKTSRVQSRLNKLEKEPGLVLEQAGLPADKTANLQATSSWREILLQRYPVPELDDDQIESLAREIVLQAEKRTSTRRRWILLQELVLLLLVVLVVGFVISAADRLAPAVSPINTQLHTRIVTRAGATEMARVIIVTPTATPGTTPYPTPSPVGPPLSLAPLTIDSSPVSVLERLRIATMFWETVWADTVTVLYGPPGYLGPDRLQRSQFWLSEDQARIQSGPLNGPPDEVWVGNHGRLVVVESKDSLIQETEPVTAGSLKRPTLSGLGLIFDPLQPLGGEPFVARDTQIRITGRDRIAGREALVVELLDQSGARSARLWLDTHTSFVLRHQQFRPNDQRNPAIETIVVRVVFDGDFQNQALFDPNNPPPEAPANDPLGRPSRAVPTINARANWESNPQPAYIDPVPDFDPAQGYLTFFYPPDFDLYSSDVQVDVFGDDYFLGNVTFANPWWMICERSPDGRQVAAASRLVLSRQISPSVYWLDITDSRRRTQRTIHIAGASDLAFAPDSRRLAMIGSGGSGYGLYLADLETDELRLLAPLEWARSLAWSPAGDQLALIGKLPAEAGPEELVVIDAQSGQVTYQARIENTRLLPADAPLLGWGADFLQQFPTKNGGLEACVEP